MNETAGLDSKIKHVCQYCNRSFARESSLLVHICETKRRYQEQTEIGVQIGLRAYLRFYEISQGSARLKNFDDFVTSPYYKAFVKFGRYCQSVRAVNVARFIDWVIQKNKKIDQWARDSVYSEYLLEYIRLENVSDALVRAIETAQDWEDKTQNPIKDYLRFGNDNALCYAITTGRLSPWAVYNCDSGVEFLNRINQEQLAMIWPWIDADFWIKKFRDYTADQEYAKEILSKAGW